MSDGARALLQELATKVELIERDRDSLLQLSRSNVQAVLTKLWPSDETNCNEEKT
jgi:hypothetical protein